MSKRKNKTISIGRDADSREFRVPVEIVTETSAVLGRRGSGKTHTAVVCAEGLLHLGYQVIILDPLDVWSGLKSSKDGRSEGFDILLLGDARKPHTDLPLDEGDAEMIADFLVDERLPCILSMRHMSKSARKRFVARFAERIYARKGDPGHNTPCLFIVDEAGTFIPQRVMGEDAAMVGAFESWVRQGRTSGIGVMLIDQRPATVNKEVLTQVELLIAHQLTAPHDKKAVREWVDEHADDGDAARVFFDSLPKLPKGTAWFWSPSWLQCFARVAVNDRTTFDSSATPKAGAAGKAIAAPKARAEIDLDALKGKLAKSIEKKKATDPALLQKRIAELERERVQYTKANAEMGLRLTELEVQLRERPAEVQVQTVELPAVDERAIKRIEDGGQALVHAIERMERVLESTLVKQGLHRIQLVVDELKNLKERCNVGDQRDGGTVVGAQQLRPGVGATRPGAPETGRQPRGGTDTAAPQRITDHGRGAARAGQVAPHRPANDANADAGDIKPVHQRILDAIAWLNTAGIAQPHRSVVAAIAGTSSTSGFYNRNVGRLSSLGLVRYPQGGLIELTDAGGKLAQYPEDPGSLKDLHKAWMTCPAIKPAHARLLSALIDAHPDALTREQLAQAVGTTANSGFYNRNVGRLSSLGLAEYPQPGLVRATSLLFPEGLA